MGMSYGMMSEQEMLMDLMEVDEWVTPEITADNYDDLLGNEDW